MERVKLNKSINWVSAKSQSSKTNRFKVLNEKDNRIKEPDIQRERHFTVLDPVNHLVGYPKAQVQRGARRRSESGCDAALWVRTPFRHGFFSSLWTIMAKQILDAKQMLICLQQNTFRRGCPGRLALRSKNKQFHCMPFSSHSVIGF